MKILNPQFNLDDFFPLLRNYSKRALFLDYDGTLAPFRIERDKALPYPEIMPVLNQIVDAGHTKVTIISGRSVKDLSALINLDRDIEMWGAHGMERLLENGTYRKQPLPDASKNILTEIGYWADKNGMHDQTEIKFGSVAFHWRGKSANIADKNRRDILQKWSHKILALNFKIRDFDGGLEIYSTHANKAHAVETVLQELGKDTIAAYLGDDLTDEDAFQTIKGKGAAILVRSKLRKTKADIQLIPPLELQSFLAKWHQICVY